VTISDQDAHIVVLGGGAWGTALAQSLRLSGRRVTLWARSAATVAEVISARTNATYLPDVTLDAGILATTDLSVVGHADIVLLVTPAQTTRATADALKPYLKTSVPLVLCAKGLEQTTGRRLSTVVEEVLPGQTLAVLSGPGFAGDVVRGMPTAVTLGCGDAALGEALATALGSRSFRIYWTDDVAGVELGGSVKNVLAIAAGILDGRKLGASAHAALVTRGFAELRRFAQANGARAGTVMGLSGLGDLLLTCGSAQSRNMSLGRALGQGQTLDAILRARKSVSEGVATAAAVVRTARAQGIEMPIAEAVGAIVAGSLDIDRAIDGLLTRPFKAED
jgi:glycerol-3-phosphate dehydrogenase (NAD(P)+)